MKGENYANEPFLNQEDDSIPASQFKGKNTLSAGLTFPGWGQRGGAGQAASYSLEAGRTGRKKQSVLGSGKEAGR